MDWKRSIKLVSRDIKPDNILLDRDIPKITDFGLAHSHALQPLTCSVEMKGIPAYMPPEQFLDFRRTDEKTESPFFEGLNLIIQKATEEEKEKRFGSVNELKDALVELTDSTSEGELDNVLKSSGTKSLPKIFPGDKKWFVAILILIATSFSIPVLWFLWPRKKQVQASPYLNTMPNPADKTEILSPPTIAQTASKLPRTLIAEDGATLRLIPGETANIPPGSLTSILYG